MKKKTKVLMGVIAGIIALVTIAIIVVSVTFSAALKKKFVLAKEVFSLKSTDTVITINDLKELIYSDDYNVSFNEQMAAFNKYVLRSNFGEFSDLPYSYSYYLGGMNSVFSDGNYIASMFYSDELDKFVALTVKETDENELVAETSEEVGSVEYMLNLYGYDEDELDVMLDDIYEYYENDVYGYSLEISYIEEDGYIRRINKIYKHAELILTDGENNYTEEEYHEVDSNFPNIDDYDDPLLFLYEMDNYMYGNIYYSGNYNEIGDVYVEFHGGVMPVVEYTIYLYGTYDEETFEYSDGMSYQVVAVYDDETGELAELYVTVGGGDDTGLVFGNPAAACILKGAFEELGLSENEAEELVLSFKQKDSNNRTEEVGTGSYSYKATFGKGFLDSIIEDSYYITIYNN